jgi:hypothetical protein
MIERFPRIEVSAGRREGTYSEAAIETKQLGL